jgi:hypothetical protein
MTMYSLLYFYKLLYMFRVVTPPIIRSTYKCTYSIWHWLERGFNGSTIAKGSIDGLDSARSCNYVYMCS